MDLTQPRGSELCYPFHTPAIACQDHSKPYLGLFSLWPLFDHENSIQVILTYNKCETWLQKKAAQVFARLLGFFLEGLFGF